MERAVLAALPSASRSEGHHERFAPLAGEIVNRRPDLIVTGTNPVVTIFAAATSTIPIVAFMLDPLKAGLVTSLSRPGGNLTGITLDPGIEIWGKRLEMLKAGVSTAAKVAFLGMRGGWDGSYEQTHDPERSCCRSVAWLSFGNTTLWRVAELGRTLAGGAGSNLYCYSAARVRWTNGRPSI
jgi:ABC transporter substrate binding protein